MYISVKMLFCSFFIHEYIATQMQMIINIYSGLFEIDCYADEMWGNERDFVEHQVLRNLQSMCETSDVPRTENHMYIGIRGVVFVSYLRVKIPFWLWSISVLSLSQRVR